jgi:glycosyltransferase involved in cell wall biosynthesis
MAFLLTAFILKKKPRFTYSINSFSAITAMARFGELLKVNTATILALFGYETYTANDGALLKHPIFRSAFEMPNYLVTDTKRLQEEIDRHIPNRTTHEKTTVHCYLASKHLTNLIEKRHTRKTEPSKPAGKVLWASRFINSKRPDIFVEIAKRFPEIEFLAYGSTDGDITGESALQIERVMNTPNIAYRGAYEDFSDIDLSEVIGFLYTSESDGIPWVLLEATAAGLAIVAPDVGGIGEFLTKENSWFVDKCDDVNAYVECVGELLSNPALAKEKATIALERLQEQHSEEAFAARLADILKK